MSFMKLRESLADAVLIQAPPAAPGRRVEEGVGAADRASHAVGGDRFSDCRSARAIVLHHISRPLNKG
jgi:hypothetical protein